MRYPDRYRKGYTPAERKEAAKRADRKKRENKTRAKTVIVWDGEGMKLSGQDKAQHYVLFGCSARPDSPLRDPRRVRDDALRAARAAQRR